MHSPVQPGLTAFLTRSRRRSGKKSKATHSGGLLGNELLAVRTNLALFVLEEAERPVLKGSPLWTMVGAEVHVGSRSPPWERARALGEGRPPFLPLLKDVEEV